MLVSRRGLKLLNVDSRSGTSDTPLIYPAYTLCSQRGPNSEPLTGGKGPH